MGDFPDNVIQDAWRRSESRCECTQTTHGHTGRCNKTVYVFRRGDRKSEYCWEAHHIGASGDDTLLNCEILCCDCYDKTS